MSEEENYSELESNYNKLIDTNTELAMELNNAKEDVKNLRAENDTMKKTHIQDLCKLSEEKTQLKEEISRLQKESLNFLKNSGLNKLNLFVH